MKHPASDQRGFAMGVVMVTMLIMMLIAGYVANINTSQRRLITATSGKRIASYYRAQAGIVHAFWRVRSNHTSADISGRFSACAAAGNFGTPAFVCDYTLDVDGDGTRETAVHIGPEQNATRQRQVTATG